MFKKFSNIYYCVEKTSKHESNIHQTNKHSYTWITDEKFILPPIRNTLFFALIKKKTNLMVMVYIIPVSELISGIVVVDIQIFHAQKTNKICYMIDARKTYRNSLQK